MTIEEMAARLFQIVDTLSQCQFKSVFPFEHTYNGAGGPTLQAMDWLEPCGYLKAVRCAVGGTNDCWQITRAGFELIRDRLPADLKAQGDAYYEREIIE